MARLTRIELVAGGVIVALLAMLAVAVLGPASETRTMATAKSRASQPPTISTFAAPEPVVAPQAPVAIELMALTPGSPTGRAFATIRLANGEVVSVSAGTTVGDSLRVLAIDPRGMDVELNGQRMRVALTPRRSA